MMLNEEILDGTPKRKRCLKFNLGAVNYSKEIYEDPDRVYETLQDGHEVPSNQQEATSDAYSYPDSNIVSNPASTEQEYTYAKDADIPRKTDDKKAAPEGLESNGAVYHTLEQPELTSDDFYSYPDNTNITKQPSSELEYTYAKDTDIPRLTAKNEHEYSYAKNTEIPSIPMGTEKTNNGLSSPPNNNALYHTLEEPNPPQAPVYSTLEEPEDVDNPQVQVTDERPNCSDHTYIDVIQDSNGTDSRNTDNASTIT